MEGQGIEWREHPKAMLSLRKAEEEAYIYFKSLYPIYHHNLCLLAQRLSTEYVEVYMFVCVGMRVWSSEAWRSRLQGED